MKLSGYSTTQIFDVYLWQVLWTNFAPIFGWNRQNIHSTQSSVLCHEHIEMTLGEVIHWTRMSRKHEKKALKYKLINWTINQVKWKSQNKKKDWIGITKEKLNSIYNFSFYHWLACVLRYSSRKKRAWSTIRYGGDRTDHFYFE